MNSSHYCCIHAHFYQPPRENPWFNAIELQESAYPYHDWNQRILAECYASNAAARIMDAHNTIIDIVNNYERISFNFGPTLLTWMKKHAPGIYTAILEADARSLSRFSGHGSAIAQTYNHLIMPLANRNDKITQVYWGIEDFISRFKRKPEGMWLAETAVDIETLEILADFDIRFTILAQHQAKRFKKYSQQKWASLSKTQIDPKRAYQIHLPSGKTLALFFYDGPVSQAVAFEGLLKSGERLANRICGILNSKSKEVQLAHIATDGETYGHHHRYGDMALAYCLNYIETHKLARLTNYGEFLEKHPPQYEVQIQENTSWSCCHGIKRWYMNCGCSTGADPNLHQKWRKPLRDSLNWLRDELTVLFKPEALLKDPYKARNDFIQVILHGDDASFLETHAKKALSSDEKIYLLKLLQIQHQSLLMFTSCGWFFDDISGIEPIQIMTYAARAIQLATEIHHRDLEPEFLNRLKKAPSNVAQYQNGKKIYTQFVRPLKDSFERLVIGDAILPFQHFRFDQKNIDFVASRCLDELIYQLSCAPKCIETVSQIIRFMNLMETLQTQLTLWNAQNIVFRIKQTEYLPAKKKSDNKWRSQFKELMKLLHIAHFRK